MSDITGVTRGRTTAGIVQPGEIHFRRADVDRVGLESLRRLLKCSAETKIIDADTGEEIA